jgi:nitrogen PTS system EIIA component
MAAQRRFLYNSLRYPIVRSLAMIDLHHILDVNCVQVGLEAGSKKRAIECGSELIERNYIGISARALFDQLTARERLGSTGLGEGIAIPHCRSDAVSDIVGALLRLAHPVEFDAPDGEPVDLLFLLVVPKGSDDDHLKVLAQLARIFGDASNRRRLRSAATSGELYDAFGAMLQDSGSSAA